MDRTATRPIADRLNLPRAVFLKRALSAIDRIERMGPAGTPGR